jgi:hypothetical protein
MKISRQWSMFWVMVIVVIAWSCQKEDLSPEKDKSFNETSSNSLRDNLTNGLWNDNVTGYTIRQIEDALIAQKTWNAWRDNIKSKYDNATENNLDALFANWN